jgi:uncharacterized protein
MRLRSLIAAGAFVALIAAAAACKKDGAPAPAAAAAAAATPSVTPNAAESAAGAAAAQALFQAMKLPASLNDTTAAMIDSEIARNPGLTPYREIMVQWLRKYMTWDAMQPELTKMYTETFTEPELKEMAKFYGSPVGQKALEKMPEMMQRVAMTGARISQPHTDELRAAMSARSDELRKEAAAGGNGPMGQQPPGSARPQGRPQGAPARPAPAPRPTP